MKRIKELEGYLEALDLVLECTTSPGFVQKQLIKLRDELSDQHYLKVSGRRETDIHRIGHNIDRLVYRRKNET